ncbi:HD domain-containing protein [Listeria ivanovii]|uniref:HD domain-containing protein n=2 Tax=Listeria ivanovii TaxID=1638 RepID=A0ABS1G3N7_LISIV|nr:HD domain-containing protein [Listeria ivanovii]EFR98084.1 HD domain-containing protein [Listeria ivanovii FSL F6-596]AIS58877.1 hypothetical protein JL58_02295 [Listeria ivanovii subsp. londoniensis]AIS61681.1 hypothetical protein JL53_02610 [Listeria ivanovii subsp. londoniensis]MBK1961271.1 HD domain-containing protein [Listeria ivanovii subsp. londoniensis]MBK1965880.1 HD domain-containing protein [Listeria ivanovii subsp. londoniensis]
MKITNPIYGTFEIEKVLEELIASPSVTRLGEIHQGGASYLVNPLWNVTRLEHSIGVMLFIRRFGGSLEEQIAGLLHDVSHTAFSHTVDEALKLEKEDYHEQIFKDFVKKSTIPTILEKYGYSYEKILADISKWKILEQEAPELCADRIDYTLVDLYRHEKISLAEATYFLDKLVVINGQIYLTDVPTAEWFVEQYYSEVIDYFYDPLNIFANEILAIALRLALQQETITTADFQLTDAELLAKLMQNPDVKEQIQVLWSDVRLEENHSDYTFHQKKKTRLINPSVLVNGLLIPVADISEKVRKMNRVATQKSQAGIYLKVIQPKKETNLTD